MSIKQTVKIFLAEGNPTGLRTLELFNWNGKGFVIPRDRLDEALKRDELKTQGVYILIGEGDDDRDLVYIGESENLAERLRSHNKGKDFWETAICFYFKDTNLNKAHVKYLEELLIKETFQVGRVGLENNNQPQKTKLSESEEADVLIAYENIKLILATIGFTFLKEPIDYEENKNEVFVCKGPGANAEGVYVSEGFLVFKGSLARVSISPGSKERYLKIRPQLIESEVIEKDSEESYIFKKDYVFSSPSNAAQNILGRNANGWTEWKRKTDGKSLDLVYRS